ncbi:MAG: DUF4097 family beta strand repeat protein [Clostridia bacterium]|nr:DUF4097 family beta strand repeat protein [Clostridia bacterium]
MKSKGAIITLIILLVLIIALLVMFLVYGLTGKGFQFGFVRFGSKSTKVVFDKKFDLDEIEKIEIKQDAGDIIFKKTSNDYVQVVLYGEDNSKFHVDMKNSTLSVDYTDNQEMVLFSFGAKLNDIIVYLPASYEREVKISNDYGKCEIEDFEEASFNIECDAGNVEIGKIKDAKIKCDYGNIEIDEILNKCDIKADCGNIDIDRISIQENSKIKADLGNVNIGKANDIYIDASVDLGKTNISQNNRNAEIMLTIKCDCGNVTVGK